MGADEKIQRIQKSALDLVILVIFPINDTEFNNITLRNSAKVVHEKPLIISPKNSTQEIMNGNPSQEIPMAGLSSKSKSDKNIYLAKQPVRRRIESRPYCKEGGKNEEAFLIFMSGVLTLTEMPARLYASPIDLSAFSGNETVIDFSTPFERNNSPLNYQGVTFRVVDWPAPVNSADLAANGDWGYFFRNIPGASGGYAMNDFIGNTQLRIEFDTNVNRLGLLLSSGAVTG